MASFEWLLKFTLSASFKIFKKKNNKKTISFDTSFFLALRTDSNESSLFPYNDFCHIEYENYKKKKKKEKQSSTNIEYNCLNWI